MGFSVFQFERIRFFGYRYMRLLGEFLLKHANLMDGKLDFDFEVYLNDLELELLC